MTGVPHYLARAGTAVLVLDAELNELGAEQHYAGSAEALHAAFPAGPIQIVAGAPGVISIETIAALGAYVHGGDARAETLGQLRLYAQTVRDASARLRGAMRRPPKRSTR